MVRRSVLATRRVPVSKVPEVHSCSINCAHKDEWYKEEDEPDCMYREHCAKGHTIEEMHRVFSCPDWSQRKFSELSLYEKFYQLYPEERPDEQRR